MQRTPKRRSLLLRLAWLPAAIPLAAAVCQLHAQVAATRAEQLQAYVKASVAAATPAAPPVAFNDVSPQPTKHDLSKATYVGYQVCAGCHGRLTSTRPDHTIIQEWEASTNAHSIDAATLAGGRVNCYERMVTDGEPVDGPKQCGVCHTTGAPTFKQPQKETQGGFDPSIPWNDHLHNVRFLKIQCENCHGPGSQHVLSGGDTRLINRVPEAKQTCWNCHVNAPNEKGNTLAAPATDAQIAKYSSSLGHSHSAGGLIAGAGGYEYAGEDYSQGHNFPHTKIADTCVTCHAARNPRSPTLNHSTVEPQITACRNCHSDANRVATLDDWQYMKNRQQAVRQLLAQLGGVTATGDPDFNAAGGLLGNAADKNSPEYRRARWNYMLVINDSSLGVHNFDYALELLTTSIAHAPAQKTAAASAPAPTKTARRTVSRLTKPAARLLSLLPDRMP
jgi:hypothetical protein